MNSTLQKLSLLLVPIFAVGFIWQRHITKPAEMLTIFVSTFALYAVLMRYVFVGHALTSHVAVQADANRRSLLSMWGEVFKKVALYLLLPAAIVTAVTVGIALLVTRNQ